MRSLLHGLLLSSLLAAAPTVGEDGASERPEILVLVGAGGQTEYERDFSEWAFNWEKAGEKGGAETIILGPSSPSDTSVKEDLFRYLKSLKPDSPRGFWLVLIGHGTFDGKIAKFNLQGPDMTAEELKQAFQGWTRPLVFVDCSSSSAPFLSPMAGENRIVITSTRSGYEQNFSRFGGYFSEAIADLEADLDKDRQTSLLEAFLTSSRRLTEFYASDNRLVTEHPLLDDNGDGKGTPADWFQGIRAVKKARDGSGLDGFRAHQAHLVWSEEESRLSLEARRKRDALELEIESLRAKKAELGDAAYYGLLEDILIELALIYEASDAESASDETTGQAHRPQAETPVKLIPTTDADEEGAPQ